MKELWIISGIILGVGLIVLLVYYRRYKKLQKGAVEKFLQIISKIRNLRKSLRYILKGGNKYLNYTAEPYKKEIQEFRLVAKQATTTVLFVSDERIKLIHLIPRRPQNILAAFFVDIFICSRKWAFLNEKIEKLEKYLAEPQSDLELVIREIDQLKNLPWKTAVWAREIKARSQESALILLELYRWKVHGKTLQNAVARLKDISFDLKNIPENYFSASRIEILFIPNRIDLTILAHSVLLRISSPGKNLLDEIRYWKKVYLDSREEIKNYHSLLLLLKDAFAKSPSVIDMSKKKTEFSRLIQEYKLLQSEFSKPTIEMLKSLGEKGQLRAGQSKGLYDLVSRVSIVYTEFCEVTENINKRIKELERNLYYQEHRPDYPMLWSVTTNTLEQLSLAFSAIDAPNTPRTIEQLDNDGSLVNTIKEELKGIEANFQDKTNKAHSLRGHWAHCKEIFISDWLEKIDRLVIEVVEYDFDNWERADRVSDLHNDANDLFIKQKEILPHQTTHKIDEQNLGTLLGEAKDLTTNIDTFEKRRNNIVFRLREIKREEKDAKKTLETLLPTAQEFVRYLDQNRLPLRSANNLVDVSIRGQQLVNEINQPKTGCVFSKAKNISDWKERIFQFGESLIDELQTGIDEKQNRLMFILDEIKEYAGEIYDSSVEQAQRYQPVNVYSYSVALAKQPEQKLDEKTPIQLLYDEIIPLVSAYEEISTCEQNIEINISPLREQYHEVYDSLDQVEQKWAEAAQSFDRDWPPLIEEIDIEEDLVLIKDVKERLQDLRSRKQNLRNLEHEYYQLSVRTREVFHSIENKITRDKKEQRRFVTLEKGARRRFDQRIEEMRNTNSSMTWADGETLRHKAKGIIEKVKRSYKDDGLSSDEIAYALNELFKPTNTTIDMSQNIKIHDIRLSNGSYMNMSQSR